MSRATFHVHIRGELRGPFTAEQLRDFGEAGVISRDTEVAATPTGPWVRIEALPERDLVFPPARELALKPTHYEVLNPPGDEPPPSVDEILAAAKTDGPVLRSQREQQAALERELARPAAPLNEVQAMVNEVGAVEARYATQAVPPPRRRRWSTRLKVVLTLAVLGNAVLAVLPFAYDAFGDWVSMVGFKAWFITYNGALAILYTTMPRD